MAADDTIRTLATAHRSSPTPVPTSELNMVMSEFNEKRMLMEGHHGVHPISEGVACSVRLQIHRLRSLVVAPSSCTPLLPFDSKNEPPSFY